MEQDNRPIYFQLRQLTRFFPRFQWLYRAPANEAEDEEQLSHEQPLENEQQTGSEQQPCSLQTLLPNNISREQFQEILDRYPSYIRDVYQRAEAERFHGIPNKLKGRQEPYIEKEDLVYLDQWMQKRGTPLTKKAHIHNRELIEKNSNANVRRVTLEAFREYGINKEVVAAMDILQAGLKGVGPSRASLLLSVAFPSNLPFFSRGLYRWTHWNEKSGWAQDFKWTTDKYHSMLERVTSLIERLSISDKRILAIDVEKVAFVLEHESCISDFQVLRIVDDLTNNKQSNGKGRAKVFKVDRKEIDGIQGSIALKKIYKTGEVETARNRFLAEVTSSYHLSKLSPVHFVEFLGWNEDPDRLFIAMEYIEFGDLEECIGNSRWNEKDIKETTRQILEGLQIMHHEGIAHRDLKPQNILVVSKQPDIRVKITDFGLAKRLSNRKTTGLVTKGIGTAGYKAPEVVRLWYSEDPNRHLNHYSRHSYTFKADIWSLGCVIVRMAVGEENRLFHNDTELIDKSRLNQQVKSVKGILEGGLTPMGPKGIQFVQKLIVVKEKNRYDAESALEALKSWKVPGDTV